MRIVRLTCLFAMLLALAGCASAKSSGTSAGAGGESSTAGPQFSKTSLPSGSPSGSVSGLPGPAPSDSDGLQVSGPVQVSLLSRNGPLQPAGPYLGKDVADLLGQYRTASGGQAPSCSPAGCWSDARIPASSMLLAVRPETTSCYQLTNARTAQSAGAIELDLQLNYVCRVGVGTAARMAGWLFALPAGAVSAGDRVTVRVSPRPGTGYTTLGSATAR